MRIQKSTRHSRITGDFGESLVLYLLSKTGFECARVDHTGIDLIARHPQSAELMGISVKSRSRTEGTEGTHVNISKDHIEKVQNACRAFKCKPYIAFVVDEAGKIRVLLISLKHMLKLRPGGAKVAAWSMSDKELQRYRNSKYVMWLELGLHEGRWWN
jgi:Holliday junction resolvase